VSTKANLFHLPKVLGLPSSYTVLGTNPSGLGLELDLPYKKLHVPVSDGRSSLQPLRTGAVAPWKIFVHCQTDVSHLCSTQRNGKALKQETC
jgi:hypothetical protein